MYREAQAKSQPSGRAGGAGDGGHGRRRPEGRRGRRRVRGSRREEGQVGARWPAGRVRGARPAIAMRRDYYAVLGRGHGATPAQIRRAYQRLARQYSPDVNLWEQECPGALRRDRRGLSRPERSHGAHRCTTAGDRRRRSVADDRRERPASRVAPRRRSARPRRAVLPAGGRRVSRPMCLSIGCRRARACRRDRRGAGAVRRRRAAIAAGLGTVWTRSWRARVEPVPRVRAVPARRVTDPCSACRGRGSCRPRSVIHVVLPAGMDTGARSGSRARATRDPSAARAATCRHRARARGSDASPDKGDNLYCEARLTHRRGRARGARAGGRVDGRARDLALPARHPERAGVPTARQGHAAAAGQRARRPLRDRAGRDSPRTRRADAGAVPGARPAPARPVADRRTARSVRP